MEGQGVPDCELLKRINSRSMDKKEKIEFIDAKSEREEINGFTFKGIIDGSLLTIRSVVRQIPYILFLVLLAIIYIANRNHAEKVIRQLTLLRTEVKDMRSEQITTASELMNLSRPSNVEALIKERGLELSESKVPPFKIVKKKR
jgi:cell division protein FtsL